MKLDPLTEVIMKKIHSIFPWIRYSQRHAAKVGRVDGAKGIPEQDEKLHSMYEMQLKQVCEENVKRLAQAWQHADSKLLTAYLNAKAEFEAFTRRLGEALAQVGDAEGSLQSARDGCQGHMHFSHTAYWALLFFISLVEVPLNAIVFDLFGESKILTYVMSLGLAIVLPVCAHFLGGFTRLGIFKDGYISSRPVMAGLSAALAVSTLAGIAYFRMKFFEASGVQKVLGVSLDPGAVSLTFFAMNMIIFTLAAVASYVTHDRDAERCRERQREAGRKLSRSQKECERLKKWFHAAELRLDEAYAKRCRLFDRLKHEAEEYKDITQKLISIYREYNLRSRQNAALPASFTDYPPLDMLTDSIVLTWESAPERVAPMAPAQPQPAQLQLVPLEEAAS